jgi:hypothetical protein
MENMAKKPFHTLILDVIEKKIPGVRASQAEEDEIVMLCDILAGAIIPLTIQLVVLSRLNQFAALLSSHDEQTTKAYLLRTIKIISTD